MDMDRILEQIKDFDLNRAIARLEEEGHVLTQTEWIVLLVLAAAGLLFCFFGLKTARFWAGVIGLALGAAAGMAAAYFLGIDTAYIWIPGVVLGIALAVLGAVLRRFGALLTVWACVAAAGIYLIKPPTWTMAGICIGAGFVAGLIALKFTVGLTILGTAVCGGVLSGTAACFLFGNAGTVIHVAACALLFAAGLLVQLLLESRKRKRQSLKKAEEIRETQSTANEVERARELAENLDKIEEETEGRENPED